MVLVIRGDIGGLRKTGSFTVSGLIHGALLVWVAFGPAPAAPGPGDAEYRQEIRPHVEKLVWYHFRERLPDVGSPAARVPRQRPPRARRKFNQTLIAGARESTRPPQLIWSPAPEIELPKALELPNALAVAPKPPTRRFTAPRMKVQTAAVTPLPKAPKVVAQVPRNLPIQAELKAPVRAFTPPPERIKPRPSLTVLPAAPELAATPDRMRLPLAMPAPKEPVRAFHPPPQRAAAVAQQVELPAAPELSAPPGEATLAIAGLNPVERADVPTPPSHKAEFSAGPQERAQGSEASPSPAAVAVPWLTARGGAKDSQPTLIARILPSASADRVLAHMSTPPATASAAAFSGAVRVSSAPDAMLDGRVVYESAIQMPNITSYSGSWIVWFAERAPAPGVRPAALMQAPAPLRKVDPKYIASAATERVEGKVMLSAVIRKDGRVESVALLRHLDDRLDQSAEEALRKWEFEPARRDGVPVDVDAVFEIPFRLAPLPQK